MRRMDGLVCLHGGVFADICHRRWPGNIVSRNGPDPPGL